MSSIKTKRNDDGVDIKEKKSKKHKKEIELEEVVEEDQEEVVVEDEEEAKKLRKKLKKEKKKNKKEKEQMEVVVEEEEEEVEEKKSKKEKKEKKEKKDKSSSSSSSGLNEYNYVEHEATTVLNNDEIKKYRDENSIEIFPKEEENTYKPILSIDYINASLKNHCPHVNAYFKLKNFAKPSPIQSQCWPPLFSGRDLVGIASTGSGKTLTFLVPALLKIAKLGPNPQMISKGISIYVYIYL
jgi:ATP-dependent RNA helicase DBP3